MTILIHKKGTQAALIAGDDLFALAAPRLLNVLPLMADEQGIFTLPRAQQPLPLQFEVEAWQGYARDYQDLVNAGWVSPRVVFQAVRDGQRVGDAVVSAMTANPGDLFPVTLAIQAPAPLTDAIFNIEYDQWIEGVENDVRSGSARVHYDRQAPNEGNPFTLSGPSRIDAEHLAANGGFARFTLPRWPDIHLEDQVQIYFRPVGGVAPAQPIATIVISAANITPATIPLLIEQELLSDGAFEVTARLQDRAGNINLDGTRLDVQVDLGSGAVDLKKIQVHAEFISLFGHINCAALERAVVEPWPDPGIPKGLRFQVPLPQDGLQVGGVVQMSWQLCRDNWGKEPLAPVAFLPAMPLRPDGYLLMDQIQELIVDELLKIPSVPNVFDVSVRVGYRARTAAGGWRSAPDAVFWLSLQSAGGGLCAGRWMLSQLNANLNRSINMTQYESMGGIQPVELSEAESKARDQQVQLDLQAKRNEILQKRTSKPTKVSKVIGGNGMFSSTLADEFTFVGALENDTQTPARWPHNEIPLAAMDASNPNDFPYLNVPAWGDLGGTPGSEDVLTLLYNGVPWRDGPTFRLPYPTPVGQQFPVELQITPEMLDSLPEGVNTVSYSVDNTSVGNPDEALPQPIFLDRVAPRHTSRLLPLDALQRPANLPAPPVGSDPVFNREYLDANPTVLFPVPAYVIERRFDQIELRDATGGATIFGPVPLWPQNEGARQPNVVVPATVLEALGLGRHQLRYVLIDRAGNVSGLSNGFNLEVQLQPVPSNLLPPIVVAAINRSHFNPSGTSLPVGIPVYTGALATDQIVLSLHDDASPPNLVDTITLPAFDPNLDPNPIQIPWAFISRLDARAVFQGTWSYIVRRDGVDYPVAPALPPSAISDIDLRVVGPVNPNDPDPINPVLTVLEVNGGSGQSPANTITPNDTGLAGTMKFTPYPGAGTTDHLSFYYGVDNNGEPLLVWQGTVADAAALTPSNMIPLPWTAIQAQGNGVINALYRIRENAAAQNFQQSLNTQVTVSAITVEMRNFVWYDAPNAPLAQQNQRPGATATGVVNCSASPWNFITLILRDFRAGDPGDDPLLPAVTLQAGDLVTVFWEYHPGTLLGDSAAPPAVLRVLDERPVPASFRAGDAFRYEINYQNDLYAQVANPPAPAADSIVCRFSVRRGPEVWISRKCLVRYNTRLAGNTLCRNWVVNP
ncbi:hypothetical protein [Pseudomonas entomophila]|uniref:hypothetical protein n=1 Tax=Pseudomonas entomophila TaxID=312306 RepID=UPI00200FB76C|nr:hypothetical protein [Pseudomonas entomophila]